MNTKLKKAFIGISLATLFLLGGCSQQKKNTADPVLTKSQVVQKAKKSFRSGQVIQSVTLGTDTSSQVALASTTFGGESTVYHITNQTTSKGKTRSSEDCRYLYDYCLHRSGPRPDAANPELQKLPRVTKEHGGQCCHSNLCHRTLPGTRYPTLHVC